MDASTGRLQEMENKFAPILLGRGRHLKSRIDKAVQLVDDQESFDALFNLVFHHERLLVIRAADAVEKVTLTHRKYLTPHKRQLLSLMKSALHKELKWHLALLIPRISLTPDELHEVWDVLSYWCQNPNESRIVRVNALQGLHDLSLSHPKQTEAFWEILHSLEHTQIPSLRARIRKLSRYRV